jgi:photosystem II stability/assembly factor-like uncharacterized protein
VIRRVAGAAIVVAALGFQDVVRSQPAAWTSTPTGVTARLRGLSAASARVVWASGAGGTIIRSEDGGASWTHRTIQGAGSLDFRDIDAVSERTAYVLSIGEGEASRIYKTTDGGSSWVLQFKNGNPRAFYDAVAFRDARNGVAVGDAVDGKLAILRTSDGGAHWTPVTRGMPDALEGEGAFAASGSNIALRGGRIWIATSKSRVFRTLDDGRTWTAAATPVAAANASAGVFSIAFDDPLHGIVVGGDYKAEGAAVDNAAVTSDGGATWTLVKGLGGYRSAVGYVAAMANAKGVVVAVGPSGSDYSGDGGHSWTPIPGPGFHTLAVARGTRTVWAAGENGAVARGEF